MNHFKYFKQEGNKYISTGGKDNLIIFSIFGILFLLAGTLLFNAEGEKAIKIAMLAFSALMFLGVYGQYKTKVIIDTATRTFISEQGAFGKKFNYSFDDFSRFEVHKVSYLGLITTNVSALAYFQKPSEKEKPVGIGNFLFRTYPAQKVITELELILKQAENRS